MSSDDLISVRRSGVEAKTTERLHVLHRLFSRPFNTSEAARSWNMTSAKARRLLAHLTVNGWLVRIRHGLYATVPLGASVPSEWREDSWVIAAHSFVPCAIAGWSACEHWGFSDQIFRDVVLFTARSLPKRIVVIQETRFLLAYRPEEKLFGLKTVWRGQVPVQITDPTKTLVDILDDPRLGGGIRHVADVLVAYFESEYHDEVLLIDYARRLGNRTVFKRLGYLLEVLDLAMPELVQECLRLRSAGITSLDPAVRRQGRLSKRWNLMINVSLSAQKEHE